MRDSFLVAMLLAGCTDTPGDPALSAARFAGDWMIEQPFHALYEVSWYRFHESGELEHLRDCSLGGEVPTGFVTDANATRRCTFADRWSAPDAETLVILSACDDGLDREVVLGFTADTSANATGQTAIEIESVGDVAGWVHAPWDWSWQKCGAEGCAPSLACR